MIETKSTSNGSTNAPQPSFLYISKAIGSVVRGVSGRVDRDVVTHSILHPGLFISVVLHGEAEAGPPDGSFSVQYRDGSLIAFAVAEATSWVGVLSKRAAMRGVGISVPFSALVALGLSDSFHSLFGSERRIVVGRASADARLQGNCEHMLQMRTPDDCGRVLLDAYSMEAIVAGIRMLAGQHETGLRPILKDRMIRTRDLIEAELTGRWTVQELAGKVGLGVRSLRTHFRREFGRSVTEYARNARLDRARDALLYRDITITEAAYDAGYNSPANFATAFKRQFGYAPSQVRSRCCLDCNVAQAPRHRVVSASPAARKGTFPARKGHPARGLIS